MSLNSLTAEQVFFHKTLYLDLLPRTILHGIRQICERCQNLLDNNNHVRLKTAERTRRDCKLKCRCLRMHFFFLVY